MRWNHSITICRKIRKESKKRLESAGIRVDDVDVVDISYRLEDALVDIINRESAPFVFTSKNGVKGILNLEEKADVELRSKECYCIAPVTRDFALLSGFRPKGEGKDSLELADCIAEQGETKVLHSTAVHRREELYKRLGERSIEIEPLITYEKSVLDLDFEKTNMLMFFSPSQVDGYLKKTEIHPECMVFCIGETTANYLKTKGHEQIIVSKKSSEKSMVDAVLRYCKTNE